MRSENEVTANIGLDVSYDILAVDLADYLSIQARHVLFMCSQNNGKIDSSDGAVYASDEAAGPDVVCAKLAR